MPVDVIWDRQSASNWLHGTNSAAECARRSAVVWRVCERLLALEPQQRPRSLDTVCSMFRHRLRVRSFTVHPQTLARAIGQKQMKCLGHLEWQAPCRPELLEPPAARMISMASARLSQPACDDSSAVSQALASSAVLDLAYCPDDAVSVLRAFGLVSVAGDGKLNYENLTRDACAAFLPPVSSLPREPWRCKVIGSNSGRARFVVVPPGCMVGFIGNRGSAIASIRADLQGLAQNRCSVRLHLRSCIGGGGVACIKVRTQDSTCRLDLMEHLLESRIKEIGTLHEQKIQCRNERRIKFQEEAVEYHSTLRMTNAARCELSWAERALIIPETGIDGIGQEYIRRVRGSPVLDRGKTRRRNWLKEKRKLLVRFLDGVATDASRHLSAAAKSTQLHLPQATPVPIPGCCERKHTSLRTKRRRVELVAQASTCACETISPDRPVATKFAHHGIKGHADTHVYIEEPIDVSECRGRRVVIGEDGFNTQVVVIYKEKRCKHKNRTSPPICRIS